ncbi:MAG: hypothetical protein D3905_12075 [Candidatus Electrothrix sp. AS4_5]|nr:hypothetical protein [Candidatus Electrothrix gigas]
MSKKVEPDERVCFGIRGKNNEFNEVYWYVVKEGVPGEHIGRRKVKTPKGKSVRIKIEVKNNIFTAYINGSEVTQTYDTTFPFGSIGLLQWYQWWGRAEKIRITFDNLEIKPLSD